MFQRLIYLIYIFETKIIVSNVKLKAKFVIINEKSKTLKVKLAIIIEKLLLKTIIKLIMITKRDFLNENNIILIKERLFKLITKELSIFIKIKIIDNRLICILSYDLNKLNIIFFINAILKML